MSTHPTHPTGSGTGRLDRWREALLEQAAAAELREPLRAASEAEDARRWTALMTGAVVGACNAAGWRAAAKGHRLDLLPQAQQEYLVIDVMAFEPPALGQGVWAAPAAVFELENSARDERVAYSLWKVSCVRAPVGVVLAYRRDWEAAAGLVRFLGENMPTGGLNSGQDLVLVVGSREKGGSFPFGFFRFWRYVPTLRAFAKW